MTMLSDMTKKMQSEIAFESQTVYDFNHDRYAVRCGVCGNPESRKKRWFRSREKILKRLQLEFNFCPFCGKWVCDDCFLVDDGSGAIGICADCAKKKGIRGYTIIESMNGKNK